MDDQYAGQEKRRFKRVSGGPIVSFRISSFPNDFAQDLAEIRGLDLDGVLIDISEGGMGFITDRDIPRRALIESRFSLFSDSPLNKEHSHFILSKGEIQYNKKIKARECRVGVMFSNLSDEDRLFITNHVKWGSSS